MWRRVAQALNGWNSIEDIIKKLKIKRSVAYLYAHMLNKNGFVIQKIKKPRGTLYLISPIPTREKNYGTYEGAELVSPEIELSSKPVSPEQKIALFLSLFEKESNKRYYEEAKRSIRKIKNWKKLYKYLKAYKSEKQFALLYADCRKTVKKIPRMPERYKKIIGDKNARQVD